MAYNPTTSPVLNGSITYNSVTVNGVTYPTLDIGNLEVTCFNLTLQDISTAIPGISYATSAVQWAGYATSNTPAAAFVDPSTNLIVADMSLAADATYGDKCARGLLFNWYAIAAINSYLATNNPDWRVLTECDAKHIKNALSYSSQGGFGACSTGVTFNGLGVASSNFSGNQSDRCSNIPSQTSSSGLGAALFSTFSIPGTGVINLNSTNDSGYSLVTTGFLNSTGVYSGQLNTNIWTSSDADKQYSASILQGSSIAWRGFAGLTTGSPTYIDHLANDKDLGFAVRLCRTKITPYEFSGNQNVSLDTGYLTVSEAIVPGTIESTIDYVNSTGTWRINKCEDTVNGITVTAGLDAVPGWDKLVSPDPATGDPSSAGNITVRFSGTPIAVGEFTWNLPIGCQTIPITRTVNPLVGTITNLFCDNISVVGGPIVSGVAVSGVTFTIFYSGGNGLSYDAQSVSSQDITGLTAVLDAGTFAVGSGSLTYTISGTASAGGTASFGIEFPGPNGTTITCKVYISVTPVILLEYLGCDNVTYTPEYPPYTVGEAISVNVSIPYNAMQGGVFAGDSISSTVVTGLTLTLSPQTVLDASTGTFTGTITGTPTEVGTAIFNVCIGGYEEEGQYCCQLNIEIDPIVPEIGSLDCDNAVYEGVLQYPGSYSIGDGITITVPYFSGNGGSYPNLFFGPSTGVGGLYLIIDAFTLAGSPETPADGVLNFYVTGIPTGIGIASWTIFIGGQSCELSFSVSGLDANVSELNCLGATTSAPILSGQSVAGITLYISYTGGNGGVYDSQTLLSTPSGVTATLPAGTLAVGNGVLSLSLSGTMPIGFVPIEFEFSFPEGSEPCTITLTPPVDPGTVDLDCDSVSTIGTVTFPNAIPIDNPIQIWIAYSDSNGGSYGPSTFPSVFPGVGGLTATLLAGQFSVNPGVIQLIVTGTPSSSGNAIFNIVIGGSECVVTVPIAAPIGTIDSLGCDPDSIVVSGTLTNGVAASGVSFTIPYFGSNGGSYPANTVSSTGIVTGLTATLLAGIFNQPNGTVTYNVTGTPSGVGSTTFTVTVGNQTCSIVLTVEPAEGSIVTLDCVDTFFSGNPVATIFSSITGTIPYTGGNGGFYLPYSDTIGGLTLTIPAGTFNVGDGSIPFTIEGAADESGTMTFTNIIVGNLTCNLSVVILDPPPIIDELLCDEVIISGWLTVNQPASGVTITIPYDGSNSQPYPQNTSVSTGVTGLTATTPAGTFTNPTGQLVYTVTGTPTSTGTASFTIIVGTRTCVITIPVNLSSFFGPENPSPCQEVTYTDPGCEVLTNTCTILFNGTEVVYSVVSTTDPCQVSFQVPCSTEPDSVAEVTFLDCEDDVITTEDLPIGEALFPYLVQTSGCPGNQITLIDVACLYTSSINNIEVCSSLGCVFVDSETIFKFQNAIPPCSVVFTLPSVIPVEFYPYTVQIVFNSISEELIQLDFNLQNCQTFENSFTPESCVLPGDEVTFTNEACDIITPDFTTVLVDGISAQILDIEPAPTCSVTFIVPEGVQSGIVDIQFLDNLNNVLGTYPYSIAAQGSGSLYNVTFTPQVEGCHRIYFKTTQEDYCYYQAEGPFEVGLAVTITIDLQDYAECLVTVPPVSCDQTIIITGYVQPCCAAAGTLDNVINLNCVQYSTEECGLYSVTCGSSNCGTFTKLNCFASGCTGINDLTEYDFSNNTIYLCSQGAGIQNTTNSTYVITKISSVLANIYNPTTETYSDIPSTCCDCYAAEVVIDFPEGVISMDVYYTACTENGPQVTSITLSDETNTVSCCTYGSIFPVNKFYSDYITSITYLSESNC